MAAGGLLAEVHLPDAGPRAFPPAVELVSRPPFQGAVPQAALGVELASLLPLLDVRSVDLLVYLLSDLPGGHLGALLGDAFWKDLRRGIYQLPFYLRGLLHGWRGKKG